MSSYRMRLRFLAPLLLLVSTLPALAAEPSDADIERLLRASRAESMLGAILPQVEAAQRQQFEQITAGKQLTDAQKADIENIRTKSNEIVRRTLAWEEMKPLYFDVYRRNFSREDVRAIAKFYESTAGQRMLERTPTLMQDLMAAIQQKMVPMLQELETELKAASDAMPAPPVSPPQQRRPAPAPVKKKTVPAKKKVTTPAKKTTTTKKKK
ncbi:MAG: DUF2059 domain-containing protein [Pseudoxanthomonas sp.]